MVERDSISDTGADDGDHFEVGLFSGFGEFVFFLELFKIVRRLDWKPLIVVISKELLVDFGMPKSTKTAFVNHPTMQKRKIFVMVVFESDDVVVQVSDYTLAKSSLCMKGGRDFW